MKSRRASASTPRSSRPVVLGERPPLLPARWQQELVLALLIASVVGAVAQWRGSAAAEGDAKAERQAAPARVEARAVRGAAPLPEGAWGRLRAEEVWLSSPRSAARAEDCSTTLWPWRLPGHSRDQVAALLGRAGMDGAQAGGLLATLRCEAGGCELTPSAAQREALPAPARAALYGQLALHPQNLVQQNPFRFRSDQVQPWLKAIELDMALKSRLLRLLYPEGDAMVFADQDTLCSAASPGDRAALMRALATTPAELVTLEVAEGQGVEELVAYWGAGGREDEVRPVFTALASRPGGGSTDISHLLPRFARERLYRYPGLADPPYTCHHSALNFFAAQPDARYLDDALVGPTLREGYVEVGAARRLGDVIAIESREGVVLHSMTFVAADIVFTKNGRYHHAPWILARQRDVEATYHRDGSRLKTFRPRAP